MKTNAIFAKVDYWPVFYRINSGLRFFEPSRGLLPVHEPRGFCFWDGNKTPAISIRRLLLGDVAQEPSAAQWKEARYNGGRFSKSYFPDL